MKSIKQKLQEHKWSILISVATGIVVPYIVPLISIIFTSVLDFLLSISNRYSDSFYSKIPYRYVNGFSAKPVMLLLIGCTLAIIFVCLVIVRMLNYRGNNPPSSELIKRHAIISNAYGLMSVFAIVSSAYFATYYDSIYKKNSDFKLELIRLKQFVEKKALDSLEANWVDISNKRDYDLVQLKIKELKRKP